jgi:hypothetical protein
VGLYAQTTSDTLSTMKIGVFLPDHLLPFQHGWDVAADGEPWRQYQQARMADEYREDDW